MDEVLGLTVRVIAFYFFLLTAVRLSGKRSIGQLGPLDFIAGLVIGDLIDDILWNNQPFASGLVAASVLILIHMGFELVGAIYRPFNRFVLGMTPVTVIRDGRLVINGLRRERAPDEDVSSQMRIHGVDQIDEIKHAAWEPGGGMSIILKKESRSVQMSDLDELKKVVK